MADTRFHEYRITALEARADKLEPRVTHHDKELAVLKAKLGLYVAIASGLGAALVELAVHLVTGG